MGRIRAAVNGSSPGESLRPVPPSASPSPAPDSLPNRLQLAPVSAARKRSPANRCQTPPALIPGLAPAAKPPWLEQKGTKPLNRPDRCAPQRPLPQQQWRTALLSDDDNASRRPSFEGIDQWPTCWVRAVPRAGLLPERVGLAEQRKRCEIPLPGRRTVDEFALMKRIPGRSREKRTSGRHR